MAKKSKYDIVTYDHWDVPEDDTIAILTMPNIPKPLHGQAPRTLLGSAVWNMMRKTCYTQADDTCEICGYKPEDLRARHGHELYSIDYATQTSEFKRVACLCKLCHIYCIHTGRALTMYKHGDPLYTKEKLLEGAEHAFSLVHKWNEEHPDKEPLRLFSTWLEYTKQKELKKPMDELIEKYDIKFYTAPTKYEGKKYWNKWKLVIGNKTYGTPYATYEEWEAKMAENNVKQYGAADARGRDPFAGKVFDEIDEILKNA